MTHRRGVFLHGWFIAPIILAACSIVSVVITLIATACGGAK